MAWLASCWWCFLVLSWPAGWLAGHWLDHGKKIHFWNNRISLIVSLCKVATQATFGPKWLKKWKIKNLRKLMSFLRSLIFYFFCLFAPKVAWGATLQREIIREMRLCPKWIFEVCPDSQPAGQPAWGPKYQNDQINQKNQKKQKKQKTKEIWD